MSSFSKAADTSDLWVSCFNSSLQAKARLFCFPYAGAGSSMYKVWRKGLPPEIELCLIHLPGRDQRVREPLSFQLTTVVESITAAIIPYFDKPFMFFGHSMGALISFEVARRLRNQYSRKPSQLYVSARCAPQVKYQHSNLYLLPKGEFLETTENLYGKLPAIIKEDPAVLELFLSILHADLTMLGTHQYIHEQPLDCSISVFGGINDKSVTVDELRMWNEQTSGLFDLKMFPGDHFFIQNSGREILQEIAQTAVANLQ